MTYTDVPVRDFPGSDDDTVVLRAVGADHPHAPAQERRDTGTTAVRFGFDPRFALALTVVVAALSGLLTVAVATDTVAAIPVAVRALVSVAAALVLPGVPVVVLLRIPGRALSAALAVSVSLAATILSAQFSMVVGRWYPLLTQALLILLSLAACVVAARTLPPVFASPDSFGHRIIAMSRTRAASLGALGVALGAFVVAARGLDPADAGSYGIITEVGGAYVLGLAIVGAILAHALTRTRIDHIVAACGTAVLILFTTMLLPVATGETSVPTAFVHRGFIETLVESGMLPDAVDARFSWAGFFSAGAHMVVSAGLPGVDVFLAPAHLVFGLLLCFPLYAIAIAITGRVRLAWTAVVLYQLFNWYQQDYYAPQAVALIFYTTIIATLLWQLRRAPLPEIGPGPWRFITTAPRRTPGLVPGYGRARTLGLGAVLLGLIVANTVTHQITPILTIVALACFSLAGATRYRTLWLAAGLVFAAWFSYGATDFWMGHLQSLVAEIGQVGNAVEQGIGSRLSGDPTYQSMQYLRIAASGVFAATGFVGWLLSRHRRSWVVGGLVCAAPFSLVALQSYGGEMIIRCFVLASPVLAPFVATAIARPATALLRRSRRAPRETPADTSPLGTHRRFLVPAGAVALLVLSLLLTTNRGLNASFEASAADMVRVTDDLIDSVPPNSTIMSWSHAPHAVGPRRILDPDGPRLMFIDSYPCLDDLSGCAFEREPGYILVTTQGTGMLRLQYGMTDQYLDEELATIVDSGMYLSLYDRDGTVVLGRIDSPPLELESR